MKFEKKIIIGSIMSFIATTIGIVAIFFPDLFNLQKEKMEQIKMTISNRQDAEKFADFINKRIEDGKIFEADITIEPLEYDEELSNPNFYIETYYSKKEHFGYTLNDNDVWGNEKKFSINIDDIDQKSPDYDKELGCVMGMDYCFTSDYMFPSNRVMTGEAVNGGARIRGYFSVNQEYSTGDASSNWIYFNDIPKEQIQLKNY